MSRRLGGALAGICLAVLLSLASANEAKPPPLPAEVFFRQADLQQAKLSPSGKRLAVVAAAGGERNALMVLDLEKPGSPTRAAGFHDIDIAFFDWVNDERLIFNLVDRQRASGQQRRTPGLFSVKPNGDELKQLIQMRFERWSVPTVAIQRNVLSFFHSLLYVPRSGGDEVIVAEGHFTGGRDLRTIVAKRLNVVTGTSRPIPYDLPRYSRVLHFDADGEPRAAVSVDEGRTQVHWRSPGQLTWSILAAGKTHEEDWLPHAVDRKGQLFIVAPQGARGEAVLKRFDFATGKPETKALVSAPGFDFAGAMIGEDEAAGALGVRVITDGEQTVWFDPRMQALQARIDALLPGQINSLSCRRCAETDLTVLIHSRSDRDPGQFLIWRTSESKLQRVAVARKDIDPKAMATVDLHRVAARDGRDLPVWLTRPAGTAPGQRQKAVVMVHGGPWVRGGIWAWSPMAQFLASRGYTVIEPEFRGSTGFGREHFKAGWRQWGQAMQDDVADAVNWAVDQGLVDGKRVCIVGASYGGYSALMGLVRHPELYQCGAAWVAVSDPQLLFEHDWESDASDELRQFELPTLVGDPKLDAAMLVAVSPVAQAARIKAPLLLAYGELDRRVPLVHGTSLRKAMQAAGREPEWVLYPGEGHQWLKLENRADFARRLEAFLARHLP